MTAVKVARFIGAILVLAAWLPATSHCLWTGAGLLPGSCETEHHHGENPAHSHDNCGQCVLESGGFKLAENDTAHLAFSAVFTWALQFPKSPAETRMTSPFDSGRAPPDLVRNHFRTRAARPGRAPALL